MAAKSAQLNRLVIKNSCQVPWADMQGDARQRHCVECERTVFDFAQMTRREIEARIAASRGHLCARITRDRDEVIVTAEPPRPARSRATCGIASPKSWARDGESNRRRAGAPSALPAEAAGDAGGAAAV